MPPTADLRTEPRLAGLRVTNQRLAVLGVPRERRLRSSVDQVIQASKPRPGTVSGETVYDVLSALSAGPAQRIGPDGRAALFEARAADQDPHVVCRVRGTVSDRDCAVFKAPRLELPSAASGHVIDEAAVTFWGICPDCHPGRAATRATSNKESDHA